MRIAYKNNEIHALRFGQGKRLLIIFHGLADKAALFLNLEESLSPYFDVVAIDLPYHGESEWKRKTFKPRHIQHVVLEIMQQLGYSKFSLMAHSMGGFVALKLYELMPELVEELILLAPGGIHPTLPFNRVLFSAPVRRFFRWTLGNSMMTSLTAIAFKLKLMHRSFFEFIRLHFQTEKRRNRVFNSWVSLYYFDISLPKIQALLAQYTTPLHFFYGNKDKITPVHAARTFAKELPHIQITIVEDGHFFIRSPLKEALAQWLAQRTP